MLLGFCTRFSFTNVYKGCSGFILFCLDLELPAKIKKDLVSTHSLKPFLLITQDLNKIKAIPNSLLKALLSKKYGGKFQQKILNSMAVSAR